MIWEKTTAANMAVLFGVTRKTIYEWAMQGMPRENGQYAPDQCVQWWLTEKSKAASTSLDTARRKLYEAQRAKTELENARIRGELLDYEETKAKLMEIAAALASSLDALGPRIAHELVTLDDPAEIQTAIFRECREIRGEMASALFDLVGGRHDGRDHPTTPTTDRRPVGRRKSSAAARKPRARKVAKQSDSVHDAGGKGV